jgi:hypothetical protein
VGVVRNIPGLEGARGLGVFELEVDVASCCAGDGRGEDERCLDPGFGRFGGEGAHCVGGVGETVLLASGGEGESGRYQVLKLFGLATARLGVSAGDV